MSGKCCTKRGIFYTRLHEMGQTSHTVSVDISEILIRFAKNFHSGGAVCNLSNLFLKARR